MAARGKAEFKVINCYPGMTYNEAIAAEEANLAHVNARLQRLRFEKQNSTKSAAVAGARGVGYAVEAAFYELEGDTTLQDRSIETMTDQDISSKETEIEQKKSVRFSTLIPRPKFSALAAQVSAPAVSTNVANPAEPKSTNRPDTPMPANVGFDSANLPIRGILGPSSYIPALLQPSMAIPSQNVIQTSSQQQTRARNAEPHLSKGKFVLILQAIDNPFKQTIITVPLKPNYMLIGRQEDSNNGFFDSEELSKHHADIWADGKGKIWILDAGSYHGTFINNIRLSEKRKWSEPHELRTDDFLRLGVWAKVVYAGFILADSNFLDRNSGSFIPANGVHSSMHSYGFITENRGLGSSNAGRERQMTNFESSTTLGHPINRNPVNDESSTDSSSFTEDHCASTIGQQSIALTGKRYFRCLWKMTGPFQTTSKSRVCRQFFDSTKALLDHVLTAHNAAYKNEAGRYIDEYMHYSCGWNGCNSFTPEKLVQLREFTSHFKTHFSSDEFKSVADEVTLLPAQATLPTQTPLNTQSVAPQKRHGIKLDSKSPSIVGASSTDKLVKKDKVKAHSEQFSPRKDSLSHSVVTTSTSGRSGGQKGKQTIKVRRNSETGGFMNLIGIN